MLTKLRNFHSELSKLKTSLPKPQTSQVRSKVIKKRTQALVDDYFRQVRHALTQGGITDSDLANLDNPLQQLLEFAHRSVTAAKYAAEIKAAFSTMLHIEQLCTKVSSKPLIHNEHNDVDGKIIRTLEALMPSAAASYQQAILDLKIDKRFSWRGPATDLREVLRETLDHLAPDKEVEAQSVYKQEADTKGPTMKQKVRYILSMRGINRSTSATTENAVLTVDSMLGSFVRSVYTRSSVSTHTPTDKNEVIRIHNLVRVALCELLEIPT